MKSIQIKRRNQPITSVKIDQATSFKPHITSNDQNSPNQNDNLDQLPIITSIPQKKNEQPIFNLESSKKLVNKVQHAQRSRSTATAISLNSSVGQLISNYKHNYKEFQNRKFKPINNFLEKRRSTASTQLTSKGLIKRDFLVSQQLSVQTQSLKKESQTVRESFFDTKSSYFPLSRFRQSIQDQLFSNISIKKLLEIDQQSEQKRIQVKPKIQLQKPLIKKTRKDHFELKNFQYESNIFLSEVNECEVEANKLISSMNQLNDAYNLSIILQAKQILDRPNIDYPFKLIVQSLLQEMMKYILVDKKSLPDFIKQDFFDLSSLNINESQIQDLLKEKVPYYEVYNKLLKHFYKLMKINSKQVKESSAKIKMLNEQLSIYKDTIEQIEKDRSAGNNQHEKDILQARINQLIEENALLHKDNNIQIFRYQESLDDLEETQISLSRIKRDFRNVNEQRMKLHDENLNLQQKLQLFEKERYELEKKFDEKSKQLETSLVMMHNNKIKLDTYERQLNDIQTQNYRLGIKAATAFTELTPRYNNFPEIFSEFNISLDDNNGKRVEETPSSIGNSSIQEANKTPRLSDITKKYTSQQLIQKLVDHIITLKDKINELRENQKSQIIQLKKQTELIVSLNKQLESQEVIKKKQTSFFGGSQELNASQIPISQKLRKKTISEKINSNFSQGSQTFRANTNNQLRLQTETELEREGTIDDLDMLKFKATSLSSVNSGPNKIQIKVLFDKNGVIIEEDNF